MFVIFNAVKTELATPCSRLLCIKCNKWIIKDYCTNVVLCYMLCMALVWGSSH